MAQVSKGVSEGQMTMNFFDKCKRKISLWVVANLQLERNYGEPFPRNSLAELVFGQVFCASIRAPDNFCGRSHGGEGKFQSPKVIQGGGPCATREFRGLFKSSLVLSPIDSLPILITYMV